MSNRIRAILIVSIVLNIFLLGAIAGSVWAWTRGYGGRAGWRAQVAEALPREQRRAFRAEMRQTVLASAPLVREGRAARGEAARLFVQPGYDAAAVTAALDRARAADGELRARLEHRVVEFAANLPVEERAKLAEALRQGPFRQPAVKRK